MLRVHTFTEAGGHVTNEDAFELQSHPLDSGCCLCFLADGQGGQAGGALAAWTACRVGMDRVCGLTLDNLGSDFAWSILLQEVDRSVAASPEAGLTTLAAFCIRGNHLLGASAGDSAVVAVSSEQAPRILTRHQQKNPPVGSGEAWFVPFQRQLTPPWRVLAVTDGVWKYVGWERLLDLASHEGGERLLERLQEAARLPGSGRFQDDFTIVLIEESARGSSGPTS